MLHFIVSVSTAEPNVPESGISLAMNCDNGDADANNQQQTNWLDIRKAEKARNSNSPTQRDMLKAELDAYLAEPIIMESSNPLPWWRSNHLKYPSVALVARAYLGIPATSVASERVFSKCGRVCTERRSLLSPQHVEQLVFLAQNLPDEI